MAAAKLADTAGAEAKLLTPYACRVEMPPSTGMTTPVM
jgi:hypothetical protein